MSAREEVRAVIIGEDRASDAFSRAGRSAEQLGSKMDGAAARTLALNEALRRQKAAVKENYDEVLKLAAADDSLSESERKVFRDALEADAALRREAEAKKKSAEAARKAAAENDGFAASLRRLADSAQKGGGPGWLGPALALGPVLASLGGVTAGAAVGLGGAAVAGGGALAAFGAVAKPVLASTLKAEQQVQAAQDAYTLSVAKTTAQYRIAMDTAKTRAQRNAAYAAEQKGFAADRLAEAQAIGKSYANLSPQQVALSKQLGDMANAWQNVKAAETPVVAGALQPWLKSVTDLTGKLAPVIAGVSPVIRDLGTDVDRLVNSAAFRGFRDFVAGTGSWAVAAAGGTLVDFVKSFMILLPKFNPLIEKAVGAVGGLGPAVLSWSQSKKASEDITKFMGWFSKNGPAVGGLLRNIGGALKALAPGLGPASVTEVNVISQFFGVIGKLPPSVAKPLLEVAGAMLTLNKLGVVKVGVKLLGPQGGAAAAEGGAAAGLWAKLLPGVRLAGGALVASVGVSMVLKNTSSGSGGRNWWENPFGQGTYKDPKTGVTKGTATALTSWVTFGHDIEHYWDMTWHNTYDRMLHGFHDVAHGFDVGRHEVSVIWDGLRHDMAHWWDMAWNNTVGRLNNGMNDTDRLLRGWEHDVAHWFDVARHDVAAAWDVTWNNTVGRTARGVSDVIRWLGTLPGRAVGALKSLGGDLLGIGKWALNQLLAGLKSAAGSLGGGGVLGWLGGFAKGVVGVFKKIWGWFSPSTVMYEGGKSLMQGLAGGIRDHAHMAMSAAASAAKGAVGGGTGQWAGLVARALKMEGLPQALAANVLYQMQTESGGNPRAINLTDANAAAGDPSRGLMQVIMSTFRAYHWPGTSWDIYDPLANIAAAINYARNVYGPNLANQYGGIGSGRGYAAGTLSAAPGWAWVGERGPELMRFRGGEQVLPAGAAGRTEVHYHVQVNVPPTVNPREAGRQVADLILAHTRSGGRLYPAGTVPR